MFESVVSDVQCFREKLHRFPEAAGKEFKTCAAIRHELAAVPGVKVCEPFLGTDTVAFIDGKMPGRNVTLRADIDALPVVEETGAEFASEIHGMMHACGHDIHAAILLGTAKVLAEKRFDFNGSIRLVFQPGEESMAMAGDLIAAGALKNPESDFSAALHVTPGLPIGTAALRTGCMASACKHYKVVFKGKTGHGSLPHLACNPILAAAAAINELQYVVTNRIDAKKPAILSICNIAGGHTDNVIPESCVFGGTLRAFDDETLDRLFSCLNEICQSIANIHHVTYSIDTNGYYPAVINPADGVSLALEVAKKVGLQMKIWEHPAMSSEDFSYFLQNSKSGVFIRLGAGEELPPLHNAKFLPSADVIRPGIALLTEIALQALTRN